MDASPSYDEAMKYYLEAKQLCKYHFHYQLMTDISENITVDIIEFQYIMRRA